MSSEKSTRDRFTFQFAELKRGNLSALALGHIALDFIRSYRDNPHYEELLSELVRGLSEHEDTHTSKVWRDLAQSLSQRQHALLEEARKSERRPKKWMPNKPVKDTINESSDEDAVSDVDSVELEERRKMEEAAQKAQEEEWKRIQDRMDALERQRAQNAAELAAKARQVDATALEEKLKQGAAVLLNAGKSQEKKRGGGKGGKEQALSAEEIGSLYKEVAEVMKEKESLRDVLSASDDDLPAKIEEAKKELARVKAEAEAKGNLDNKKAKEMPKGQVTQLQQKLQKQSLERNRLALQLKALEPNPQRDELVELLGTVNAIAVQLELAQ